MLRSPIYRVYPIQTCCPYSASGVVMAPASMYTHISSSRSHTEPSARQTVAVRRALIRIEGPRLLERIPEFASFFSRERLFLPYS